MPCAAQFVKNLQRFRLVTFDVTDTLLRFRKPPAIQYAKTAADLGVTDIDQHRLSECFSHEFKTMAKLYPNFGCGTVNMTWHEWWIKLVENIFLCVKPNIEKKKLRLIAETLIKIYRTNTCWAHIDGGRELIKRVRDAGKYIGIISNFDPSLRLVLKEMDIGHNFDFVLTSYESGVQKPHAKIFKIPLEWCKVDAHEALHIGNIYEIDYLGARNSGWSSLLITKTSGGAKDANATHVHNSLTDLLKAMDTTGIKW